MTEKIKHTSESELTHSMVHYLLAIHKLKELNGYARVTDIAKDLQLTKGSVSTALNNLKKRALVLEDESKFLTLSDKGHDEVHKILSSRALLFYFLKDFIGVSPETAKQDSCLMEHLVSEETMDKFFSFMKNVLSNSELKSSLNVQSALDLTSFLNSADFVEKQEADSGI